jgi:16S rRNA G966 N2-methylase RsmD
MKHLFYDSWYKKRLNKIINIFGKDWFLNKRILELGACHGDIGIELLKLGSDVTFSDVREEHLTITKQKLQNYNYYPSIKIINQETEYVLEKSFDLILHLGVLYHLDNWEKDLKCSISNTNIMILETLVNPRFDKTYNYHDFTEEYPYGPYNSTKMSVFTQEEIEKKLTNLGCKFIRFDNSGLNCSGWISKDYMINHIYDWTYEKYNSGFYELTNNINHFRRMWLVIR